MFQVSAKVDLKTDDNIKQFYVSHLENGDIPEVMWETIGQP